MTTKISIPTKVGIQLDWLENFLSVAVRISWIPIYIGMVEEVIPYPTPISFPFASLEGQDDKPFCNIFTPPV
jgi:hypothetical protein